MKEKIIKKASELFLKLGFKSITMDDIACEMCISKKTIYKYFSNKESLIKESTVAIQKEIRGIVESIISNNFNVIEENFEIRKMFSEMFKTLDTSPVYQLKKHYPEIYAEVMAVEVEECRKCFGQNIEKGITSGFYRKDIDVNVCVLFYYTLIFSINENTISEKEAQKLELKALEYHTRAIATPKGIEEFERLMKNYNAQ